MDNISFLPMESLLFNFMDTLDCQKDFLFLSNGSSTRDSTPGFETSNGTFKKSLAQFWHMGKPQNFLTLGKLYLQCL